MDLEEQNRLALDKQKRAEFRIQQRLDLEEQNHLALEIQKRVQLEIQEQLKLDEHEKLTASITIQKWRCSSMLRRLESERDQCEEHRNAELCLATISLQQNHFRMVESSPTFIHKKQSCELTAMGMETVPTPSIWNTD